MKLIKRIFLTIALVFCYMAITVRVFGMTCPLRIFFGIPCPGCGMTRAIIAILHLDFKTALYYHPMIILLPLIGYIMLRIISGKITKGLIHLLALVVALFVITYVLRIYLGSDVLLFDYSDSFLYPVFHNIYK